ncbi:glycosyltransferase [Microbulbifer agarilyticus]|uniref:glycosyltransferase n=1 Tax=Microbulbifer agarilyticus TaxID=260552 RepID=UPI001C976D67|nr:glycosyltransferase [Microbulbifer agarilyticus]MBY6190709.1 glycosyltransferase [Microbulbifer agarilyticus]
MKSLLIITSAPAARVAGKPFLDKKFCEGMRFYAEAWGGPVSCVAYLREAAFPFGQEFEEGDLPFKLRLLNRGQRITAEDLVNVDLVLCSGDNHEYFYMSDICAGLQTKLVYVIEYILETRLQINFLDPKKNFFEKLYSAVWNVKTEFYRRRAFKRADGLQANGFPSFSAYQKLSKNTLRYLDNRTGSLLFATDQEMASRVDHLNTGKRIRVVHSGRLEPMKGSQDLIPIARALTRKNIDFELHIFGAGSLESDIREDIELYALQDRVFLRGAIDFETELVPFVRQNADVYLSCHRQSDPSCSYIENMACGVAIAGYSNRMWTALCEDSKSGWCAPLGDYEALASKVAQASVNRKDTISQCKKSLEYANKHAFEKVFSQRIDHLLGTLSAFHAEKLKHA